MATGFAESLPGEIGSDIRLRNELPLMRKTNDNCIMLPVDNLSHRPFSAAFAGRWLVPPFTTNPDFRSPCPEIPRAAGGMAWNARPLPPGPAVSDR